MRPRLPRWKRRRRAATVDRYHIAAAGSDYMVDVMMALGYTYVAATPGTTFRGLQESVINHAIGKIEWISTAHEEISGSLAHGYAKASGKPMAIMVHNTVGLQHATMAIYNAWADRVPMLVMLGNYADGALRVGGADWDHAATDDAAMCRGYIKYDEQPGSLEHYKESMLRGHGIMMTAPMGPMIMVVRPSAARVRAIEKAAGGDAELRRRTAALCRSRHDRDDCEDARQRVEPGDHRRPCNAHASRRQRARCVGRSVASTGHRPARPHELSVDPLSQQSAAVWHEADRDPRARSRRSLQHRQRARRIDSSAKRCAASNPTAK